MKNGILSLSLMALSFSAYSVSVIPSPVDHLFVPKGFDNNDNVELVVTGKFPSPCYTRNNVDVKILEDKILVSINAQVKEKSSSGICEPLKVPFSEVVNVGNLQGGDYEIIVNNELKEKLFIETSNSQSVDDHIYASIQYVELGFTGGLSGDATLVGKSISNCLEVDHVEYISNGKDTFSILPIMKKVSKDCPEGNERLEIPVKFDIDKLKNENVLLFVRSVDGKSIHSIIQRD
jgi:hypothetical protein